MKDFDVFNRFVEHHIGHPLKESRPLWLSGRETVTALWPLNEVFRSRFSIIRELSYNPEFEPAADAAIEAFVFAPAHKTWEGIEAGTWRVLLERHQQAMVVALANEVDGNPLMPIPDDLPDHARLGAAMLFLHHGMVLPFPPEDRSKSELPPLSALASLRPH